MIDLARGAGHLFQLLRERSAKRVDAGAARADSVATSRQNYRQSTTLTELKHSGLMSPAMSKRAHYLALQAF